MKEQIIKILSRYYPTDSNNVNCANEILRMAEFEALCNPDIYEANMNAHLQCLNCDELNGAISEIKTLSDNLKEAEIEIRQLNNELKYRHDH